MDIRELLKKDITTTYTNTILSKQFINSQVSDDLADILVTALDDEDPQEGVASIFIPKAYLTIINQSEATEVLMDMFDKDFQEELLKKMDVDLSESDNFVSSLSFESVESEKSTVRSSGTEGYRDVVTLKIFLTNSSQSSVLLGNDIIPVKNGDVLVFKNSPIVPYQAFAKDSPLFAVSLTIKTRLVNANIIHHPSESDIGVIIDCKDMESPSTIKDLEYGLANITRLNLVNRGFSNIVCFFGRNDFSKAVNILRNKGIKKVLVLFAGAVVNETTYEKVRQAEHITAWKSDTSVMRKYVVFDTDKYENFQIRGQYLSNVIDQVKNASHKDFGVSSLQPDETTYEFLELICRGIIPRDISLLKEAGSSEGDLVEGAGILKEIKEILLNT